MATLVIGLGNPGGEYAHTRHNVGWDCLAELEHRGALSKERREGPVRIRSGILAGTEVIVARPQTFMNESGRAGHHLTQRFGLDPHDVLVVHDEIDLPLGRLRIRRGGSAGGNRGVKSLIASWRSQDFIRVRVGVGRPESKDDVIDHVLRRFNPDERALAATSVLRAADAVEAILRDGLDAAMNVFNRIAKVAD